MAAMYRYFLLSCVLGILLLQALVLVGQITGTKFMPATRYWPIMSYAMYSESRHDGDYVNAFYPIEARLKDGTVLELTEEKLGLEHWFYINLGDDLIKGKNLAKNLDVIKSNLPEGAEVVEVIVKSYPAIVTKEGMVEKESAILKRIEIKPSEPQLENNDSDAEKEESIQWES